MARTSCGILPYRYCTCQGINWKWLMEKGIGRGCLNGRRFGRTRRGRLDIARLGRWDGAWTGTGRQSAPGWRKAAQIQLGICCLYRPPSIQDCPCPEHARPHACSEYGPALASGFFRVIVQGHAQCNSASRGAKVTPCLCNERDFLGG
jgi:hypothetical protein